MPDNDDYIAIRELGAKFANAIEDWVESQVDGTLELAQMADEDGVSLDAYPEEFMRGFDDRMHAIVAGMIEMAVEHCKDLLDK